MTESIEALSRRAAELRAAFDRSFAAPPREEGAARQDLLAIRIGAEAYAVKLGQVRGLFADRKFTRVPGGNAALLGVAGFRGTLVPVYSLGILLGHAAPRVPRWLVVAAVAPIALAFDAFDGHVRAGVDAILLRQSPAPVRGYAPEFIRTEGAVRPVLHLPSVIEALDTTQAPGAKSPQE